MENVYETCPVFEDARFLLRQVSEGDCPALLKVYSDPKSIPLFNSDNCHGDDFHYETPERMRQALAFWQFSYHHRSFVRWAAVDRTSGEAVGTIELFRRTADDYFHRCGILRLDLRSDYENTADIAQVLSLILPDAFGLFGTDRIATKAIPSAAARRSALLRLGFLPRAEILIGHDGTAYGDYLEIVRRH